MHLATLYTLYGRRAGAELFFERTLEELLRRGPADWNWTVFCNTQAESVLRSQWPGLTIRRIPWLDNQYRKAFWLEFLSHRLINREQFDLAWLPSGGAAFPGRWNIPSVVTFLDMGVFTVKSRFNFTRTAYRKYISTPRSLRRASALTAISQTTADDVVRLFPWAPPPRAILLGPSPREPVILPEAPQRIVEKETGVRADRVWFSPARTDYRGKGRDILLRAYAAYLRESSRPRPLLLPGPEGEFHDRVMSDITELGLQGKAVWPGRVSDACIEACYRISEAMLLPSRIEGFGFPVLEAMERGTPVICSDAGSLPEVAGDAALIVPQGDVQGLCAAMLKLEREPALRDTLVRRGIERSRSFSWARTAEQYVEVFRAVAAHPREKSRDQRGRLTSIR